jgi:hypothetical protein
MSGVLTGKPTYPQDDYLAATPTEIAATKQRIGLNALAALFSTEPAVYARIGSLIVAAAV